MKATLEFELPEEEEDLQHALHALDWALVVWDLDQDLRSYLKHGNDFKSVDEALEVVRERLYDLLEKYNISLNMIS